MEIKSKALGNQQVDSDGIINFPSGIPGFENQTRFKLFHQEDSEIIFWLQSLDDDELTFSVAQPSIFNINYRFILTDEEEASLELSDPADLLILILLQADDEASTPTIKGSIKSPLLINTVKQLGIQKSLGEVEQSITLSEQNSEIEVLETEPKGGFLSSIFKFFS